MKIGYVRTSTSDQNPENQIRLLMDEGVPEACIFVDHGVSGTVPVERRPGYSRMEEFIESHAVKTLYVFEISRLGRSFIDTLMRVIELEEKGIQVWSLSPAESWTRIESKSLRDLMLMIFSWVAERERENLSERTKAGLARARAEGKQLGRPNREIPWKTVEKYRKKDISISAISRILDIPYSTLYQKYQERGESES